MMVLLLIEAIVLGLVALGAWFLLMRWLLRALDKPGSGRALGSEQSERKDQDQ